MKKQVDQAENKKERKDRQALDREAVSAGLRRELKGL